jgi:hypothetical protein
MRNRIENTFLLLVAITLLVTLSGCSPGAEAKRATCDDEQMQLSKIRLEAEAKRAQIDVEAQRNDREIRLKILDRCATAGGIPVVFGGNIYCRILPKK